MAAGDRRDFPSTFPPDYANKDLAGQSAAVHVTLSEIREEILPEIDDEFAQRAGVRDPGGSQAGITQTSRRDMPNASSRS